MTVKDVYKIRSKVFLWQGVSAWHFVGIPKKQSEEIKKQFGGKAKGWGSLPVEVTIGRTKWKTSIFPDKRSGTYLLPLKAEARKKEEILKDDTVNILLVVKR